MKRLITGMIALWAVACVCFSANKADTDNGGSVAELQFKAAYQLLITADGARDGNKMAEARDLYRKAVESYARLSKRYPDWETEVIRFRIMYCANQYENIVRRIGKKPVAVPKSVATKTVAPKTTATKTTAPRTITRKQSTDSSLRQPVTTIGPKTKIVSTPRPVTSSSGTSRKQEPPENQTTEKKTISMADITNEAKKLLVKGETQKARELLMAGLDRDPDHGEIRLLLGIVQCRSGKFLDALYVLQELVEEDSRNAVARVVLGTAYFGLGQTGEAGRQMKMALELNPDMSEAHYNMARIVLETKPVSTPLARYHYNKSVDLGGARDKTMDLLLE